MDAKELPPGNGFSTLLVRLDSAYSWDDIRVVSGYCEPFKANFGHVEIPLLPACSSYGCSSEFVSEQGCQCFDGCAESGSCCLDFAQECVSILPSDDNMIPGDTRAFAVTRLLHRTIVDDSIFLITNSTDGENINGPSLAKVPSWVENPLGKYYLYFAHHKGDYIRMAYSDRLLGPYILYQEGKGVLTLSDSSGTDHLASPDVIVDDKNKRFILYYHSPSPNDHLDQYTFVTTSTNGLDFQSGGRKIAWPYARVFEYNNSWFAWAKDYQKGGEFQRSDDPLGVFRMDGEDCINEEQGVRAGRHVAVWLDEGHGALYVIYSQIGDAPERLYMVMIDISTEPYEKWMCNPMNSIEILRPEYPFEGSNLPITASSSGISLTDMHELRDPAIFLDDDHVYLLYCVRGEKGIAIAEITWITTTPN
eukprot:m.103613 g.103613  ORF g.103613 m.103613 type:complete len:420 (-) comp9098_c1_seq3:903-2162(-)